ncbi:MAG: rhomboid family intramembrane serine protease [Paludibacter sp.]|jgi:membrane associated rhomboid family serine protease
MLFDSRTSTEKRQFIHAVFIPLIIGILMILSFLLERGMNWDFHSAGVFPRRLGNLWGILTLIFIHAGWGHLVNNVVSFIVLGSCLYFFYKQIATKVLFISYIFSGLILWIIGRENWHIGASGLIYSLAFFLFFSGIIRKHIPLIAISLIVAFLYGSIVWHIVPWELKDPISWEGHLAGGIIGLVLSVWYRNEGPQKPVVDWGEDDDEIDFQTDETDEIENN